MTKDEALKLALEALEANHLLIHGSETKGGLSFCMDGYYSGCFDIDSNDKQTNKAITAIKEALAQPEQEPEHVTYTGNGTAGFLEGERPTGFFIQADMRQPEQETNKDGSPCPEFWDWLPKAYNFDGNGAFTKYNMEVAFLAGKQASQPEQEPVAWMTEDECEVYTSKQVDGCFQHNHIPLYTTPPQRKPLTDEEIGNLLPNDDTPMSLGEAFVKFARAIEAAHGIKGEA